MNTDYPRERTGLAYLLAVLGAFLIVAGLVWAMRHYTQPPPLGEDRAAVRAKALAEIRRRRSRSSQYHRLGRCQ